MVCPTPPVHERPDLKLGLCCTPVGGNLELLELFNLFLCNEGPLYISKSSLLGR